MQFCGFKLYIYQIFKPKFSFEKCSSEDSPGEDTFLAPFTDSQTRNYDEECSNYRRSISTLKVQEM